MTISLEKMYDNVNFISM